MMWLISYSLEIVLIIWLSQVTWGRPTFASYPNILSTAHGKQPHSQGSKVTYSAGDTKTYIQFYNNSVNVLHEYSTPNIKMHDKYILPSIGNINYRNDISESVGLKFNKRFMLLKRKKIIRFGSSKSKIQPIASRRHRSERGVKIAGLNKRIAVPSVANINRSPDEGSAVQHEEREATSLSGVRNVLASNNPGDITGTESSPTEEIGGALEQLTGSTLQPHEFTRPTVVEQSGEWSPEQPYGNIVSNREVNNIRHGDTSETNAGETETLALSGDVASKPHDIFGPVGAGDLLNSTSGGENTNLNMIPFGHNMQDSGNRGTSTDNVTHIDSSENGLNSTAEINLDDAVHTNLSDSSFALFPGTVNKDENMNGHLQVTDQNDTHHIFIEPDKPHSIPLSVPEIRPTQTIETYLSTDTTTTNFPSLPARPAGNSSPIMEERLDAPELVNQPITVSTTHATDPNPDHPNFQIDDRGSKSPPNIPEITHSSTHQATTRNVGSTNSHSTLSHVTDKPQSTTRENTTTSASGSTQAIESPSSYMELKFSMSWPDFCQKEVSIRREIVQILQEHTTHATVTADQIQVMDTGDESCSQILHPPISVEMIVVRMYLLNKSHQFDRELTLVCAKVLQSGFPFEDRKNSSIRDTLLDIHVHDEEEVDPTMISDNSEDTTTDYRVVIAVVLAVVGGCCCIGLIVLQIIVRRRNKENRAITPINGHYSRDSSDDSIQLSSVVKSRPNSGLYNPGLDVLDPLEPSNPLNYVQLSNFCMDQKKIAEEYEKLPQRMPRPSMVPMGEEDKNRYANVLPLVHTRVKLIQDGADRRSSYINANYVTGPNNQCQYYIATQAPTEKTTADFWTMVWQQGCKAIVMLTQMEEHGQRKCASYWPELVGKSAAHKHGDFLIELKQKDVHQEYIVSKLEVNNLRKIETRVIDHFWYTCWPPNGLPEPISLVKLVLDVRPKYENGNSPLVVHCSPGTGRTCTFIALDLCMRQFETKRIVNVMATVSGIRQERAGAIQNKEQYTLIYQALNEYATIVTTPGVSTTSSVATLQALLSS